MIAWIADPEHAEAIRIPKGSVLFQVFGQDAMILNDSGRIYLRLPHGIRANRTEEIRHETRIFLTESRTKREASLCFSGAEEGYEVFHRYSWQGEVLSIGSSPEDTIRIADQNLASSQFRIDRKQMLIQAEEGISAVLNGSLIDKEQSFCWCSCFRVLNLQIVFHPEFLLINSCGNLTVSLPRFEKSPAEKLPEACMIRIVRTWRAPKLQRELSLELEEPMRLEEHQKNPLIFMMGPALTMSSASLFSGSLAMYNGYLAGRGIEEMLPMVLLPGVMVVSTLVWNPMQRFYEKHREKMHSRERLRQYERYLIGLHSDIQEEQKKFRMECMECFPDPDHLLALPLNPASVFQKTPGQKDWLMVRAGIGTVSYSLNLKRSFRLKRDDPLAALLHDLNEQICSMPEMPAVIPLSRYSRIVIDAGEENEEFLWNMLASIAEDFGPDHLKMMFLADESYEKTHPWLRMIPQTECEVAGIRLIAGTQNEVREACMALHQEGDPPVIVVALKPNLITLLDAVNPMVIRLSEDHSIPAGTELQIHLNQTEGILQTDSEAREFRCDLIGRRNWEAFFSALSRCTLQKRSSTMQAGPSFFDLYHVTDVKSLKIREAWETNLVRDHIRSLIGIDSCGEPVVLDLHETGNGPHGLVAGMTGSGKSEFLITLVLSLICAYSPRELQIVLIDFKGGGAAQIFSNDHYEVPHIAGVLSNLDLSEMERALVSFRNECHRREVLFQKLCQISGRPVMNLKSYQKIWKESYGLPYLSAILILVDEFAELKKEEPQFMKELISIARVGRSLGIHMILATQKPSGVVDDQIWSNCRFKVCLKVQDRQDSIEMIHSPEAAWIRKPGELYLFCDGLSVHAASGYANAPKEQSSPRVQVLDAMKHVILENREECGSEETQSAAVIREVLELGAGFEAHKLWLPPAEAPVLEELDQSEGAVLGRADDFYHYRQPLLMLKQETYTMAVFAIDRSDRLAFLHVILYGLLKILKQGDELFLMDDLSGSFEMLKKAPQVCNVFESSDQELVRNLFRHLSQRKTSDQNECYVLIDDYSAFRENGESNQPNLHSLLEKAEKLKIHFIMFVSGSSAISYRDLTLIPCRISLRNSNLQDLTGIFETAVHKIVAHPYTAMIRTDHLLEVHYPKITEADLASAAERSSRRYGSEKAYVLPQVPEVISTSMYHGKDLLLGMDIETYEWIAIPESGIALILSTYPEEQDHLRNAWKDLFGNLILDPSEAEVKQILKAGRGAMLAMPFSRYQELNLRHDASSAPVIYAGEGFREQYVFTSHYRKPLKKNQAMFISRGRCRIMQIAESR